MPTITPEILLLVTDFWDALALFGAPMVILIAWLIMGE